MSPGIGHLLGSHSVRYSLSRSLRPHAADHAFRLPTEGRIWDVQRCLDQGQKFSSDVFMPIKRIKYELLSSF